MGDVSELGLYFVKGIFLPLISFLNKKSYNPLNSSSHLHQTKTILTAQFTDHETQSQSELNKTQFTHANIIFPQYQALPSHGSEH